MQGRTDNLSLQKGIDTEVNWSRDLENRLSKTSRQCQNKINRQEAQISSLQVQNLQLKGLLDYKALVNTISQAVTTSLKLSSQPANKGGAGTNGTGFVSKPYLGKSWPSQLGPGANGYLNLDLECQYCKDTSHLKNNSIKFNHQLAMKQKKFNSNVAPNTGALNSTLAN